MIGVKKSSSPSLALAASLPAAFDPNTIQEMLSQVSTGQLIGVGVSLWGAIFVVVKVARYFNEKYSVKGNIENLKELKRNYYRNDEQKSKLIKVIQYLGQQHDSAAVPELVWILTNDYYPTSSFSEDIETAAKDALVEIGSEGLSELLKEFKSHNDVIDHQELSKVVGRIGISSANEQLLEMLESSEIKYFKGSEVRIFEFAAWTLGRLKERKAIDPLIENLSHPELFVRVAAAEGLQLLGDHRGEEHLKDQLLRDHLRDAKHGFIKGIEGLGELKDNRAVNTLIAVLRKKEEDFIDPSLDKERIAAIKSLTQIKDTRAVQPLIEQLDEDFEIRNAAIVALGTFNDGQVITPLLSIMGNQGTYRAAVVTLEKVGATKDEMILALDRQLLHVLNLSVTAYREFKEEIQGVHNQIIGFKMGLGLSHEKIADECITKLLNLKIDDNIRIMPASILGELGNKKALGALHNALTNLKIRKAVVIDAIEKVGDESSIDALIPMLKSTPEIVSTTLKSLHKLGIQKTKAVRAYSDALEYHANAKKYPLGDMITHELSLSENSVTSAIYLGEALVQLDHHEALEILRKMLAEDVVRNYEILVADYQSQSVENDSYIKLKNAIKRLASATQ